MTHSPFPFPSFLEVIIEKDFNSVQKDTRTRAQEQSNELLEHCQNEVSKESNSLKSPLETIDFMSDCMRQTVDEKLAEQEVERLFQSNLRHQMATKLVPYACANVALNSSIPVINRTWHFEATPGGEYMEYQIQVLHERPTSQIFQIPNFATTAECDAIGYFVEDDNVVPFVAVNDLTKQGKLLHHLASKFYELARVSLPWLSLEFSDMLKLGHSLFDIHVDKEGTTILPQCTGEEKKEELCRFAGSDPVVAQTKHFVMEDTRLATVLLFCDKPAQGILGGVQFPDAGIHVNPKPGTLVLAIHRNLATDGSDSEMDDGFVQDFHLCPNHNVLTHHFNTKEETKAAPKSKQQQEKSGTSGGSDEL
jgi:hypothetical protein